jgi:molecular chaperone HtpG
MLYAKDPQSQQLVEWVEMLYDQALLTEGSSIEDPNRFARRVADLMSQVAGQVRAS